MPAVWFQVDELDVRRQSFPLDWKAWPRMLALKRFFEHAHRMTAMNANRVSLSIGGREKRKSHDVVPVHVGHKEIINLRPVAVRARHLFAVAAQARAHVAE